MKYLVSWEGTKRGLFSDTKFNGTQVFEGKNRAEAHEKAQEEAKRLSSSDFIFTVTGIEKL